MIYRTYPIRLLLALLSVLLAANLIPVWMHFGFKYSHFVGIETRASEVKSAQMGAYLSLAMLFGLQLLAAALLLPSKKRFPTTDRSPIFGDLPATRPLPVWKKYSICLGVSVFCTGVTGLLVLFVLKRGNPFAGFQELLRDWVTKLT